MIRIILGVFLGGILIGCGSVEPIKATGKQVDIASYTCASSTELKVTENSQIEMTTYKNTDFAVVGYQMVSGTVTLGTGTSISSAKGRIDFHPESLNSDNLLRDDRIRAYIYQSVGVSLDIVGVNPSANKDQLPTVGESIPATLVVNFNVAGKSIPLDIEVNLSAEKHSYFVRPKGGMLRLDMINDLGLQVEVASLMALVPGVTLENSLDLNFTIGLKPDCM